MNLVQIEACDGRLLHCIATSQTQHTSSASEITDPRRNPVNMPADLNGYWKMISNNNFEDYLKALGEFVQQRSMVSFSFLSFYVENFIILTFWVCATDVNVAIRKIATLLKPDKDIVHDGEHIVIKTLSTFKNYNMDFYVGKEFEEDLAGVDDRKCMVSFY